MGFSIAVRAFFAALFQSEAARRIESALRGGVDETPLLEVKPAYAQLTSSPESTAKKNVKTSSAEGRSEALELLAALQRDARFVDFIKEDVRNCDDATLGAAARLVHDRCAETLERSFEIRPLSDAPEGTVVPVDTDAASNPARLQVSGSRAASSGRIAHAGWVATKQSLPRWAGKKEDAFILAPVEVEIE